MERKKILFVVLLLFITTGCSVNYEITLDENTIGELVQITENRENIDNNILNIGQLTYTDAITNVYNIPQPVYIDADVNPYDEMQIVEGVEYYNKSMISTENKYGLEATFNYNILNYEKSKTINQCYKNISVLKNGEKIILSTSRNNLCFDKYVNLEKIEVHIKVNLDKYKIISHNADSIENGNYCWNINRENYNNRSIVIEVESIVTDNEIKNDMIVLIGFIIAIIVGALLIFFIGKKKNRNKNRF